MFFGTVCFAAVPEQMLRFFSSDEEVIRLGITAFRIIGISFVPLATSLTFPVLFQAVGRSLESVFLTVLRTMALFVPLAYLFSRSGVDYFWLTFPVTDTISSIAGLILTILFFKKPYFATLPSSGTTPALQHSHSGVIITIAREHGSSGKEIGRVVAERLGIPFYYKEMTALAAAECGLDREFVSHINRNAPKRLRELYLTSHAVRRAILAQQAIIERIAEEGSCVIVGRAADHVLREHADVVRVFIGAPLEYRISCVMEIYGDSYKEAAQNIKRADSARAAYYKSISERVWGDPNGYELVIDSSCGVNESADRIIDYISAMEK